MVSKLKYARTSALSNPREKTYNNWHTQLEAQALIALISQFTITEAIPAKQDFTEQWRPLVWRVEKLCFVQINTLSQKVLIPSLPSCNRVTLLVYFYSLPPRKLSKIPLTLPATVILSLQVWNTRRNQVGHACKQNELTSIRNFHLTLLIINVQMF